MIVKDILWDNKQSSLIFEENVIKLIQGNDIKTVVTFPLLADPEDYFFVSYHLTEKTLRVMAIYSRNTIFL